MIWGHWLLSKTPIKQRLLVLRATLFLSMLPGLLDIGVPRHKPETRLSAQKLGLRMDTIYHFQ